MRRENESYNSVVGINWNTVGAVPFLKLGNLQNTKLTVYENSSEQYFTFITPECKKALDSYLDMRNRCGEKLTNDSFLIRKQFDVRCPG